MHVSQQQKKWHGLVTTEEQNRRCCPDCGNNSFTMMTVDSSCTVPGEYTDTVWS